MVEAVTGYGHIAVQCMRAALSYRMSFWMLTIGGFFLGGLDMIGIFIMFQTVDTLGGFSLTEVAFLYGAAGLGLAVADLVVGQVERLGQLVRLGKLDVMMVRPLPLLTQVCAEQFALRRVSRVLLTAGIFTWGAAYVDWTPLRAAVAASMLICGAVIFGAIWIAFATIQFWTADSAEVANAFTYGGSTVTQYPLAIYPSEVIKALTFAVPLAFVNWYPALYILDRDDPLGLPTAFQFASPVAAAVVVAAAALAWRAGVRRYTSTGS